MEGKFEKIFDRTAQVAMPTLTILAQVVISLKNPKWGVLINLMAQPFWLYSGWKSYKKAGQIGIVITTVIITIILLGGVINYWFI